MHTAESHLRHLMNGYLGTTQLYAEKNLEAAREIMQEVG
jgi:hypothetical protein